MELREMCDCYTAVYKSNVMLPRLLKDRAGGILLLPLWLGVFVKRGDLVAEDLDLLRVDIFA